MLFLWDENTHFCIITNRSAIGDHPVSPSCCPDKGQVVQGGAGWRVAWAPQLYFNTSQPGPRPGAISWNTFHGSRCYVCPEIFKHEVVHCCVFQAYELFYISKNISCVRS